jgi:ABC-type phosphate/phosphonate transport system substrate-binding protein
MPAELRKKITDAFLSLDASKAEDKKSWSCNAPAALFQPKRKTTKRLKQRHTMPDY